MNILKNIAILLYITLTPNFCVAQYSPDKNESMIDYKNIDNWPETCVLGREQSPIQLKESPKSHKNFEEFNFMEHNEPYKVTLENTGNTIKIYPPKEHSIALKGGGLEVEYNFHHIEFHWQAEHLLDDIQYPLEAQYVYYSSQFSDIYVANEEHDGVAIVAVLFVDDEETEECDCGSFDDIEEKLVSIVEKYPNTISDVEFIPEDLLPINRHKFYRYRGSTTVPTCNETVIWTVFSTPVFIPRNVMDAFSKNYNGYSQGASFTNSRPIQDLNKRVVQFSKGSLRKFTFFISFLTILCVFFTFGN